MIEVFTTKQQDQWDCECKRSVHNLLYFDEICLNRKSNRSKDHELRRWINC